MPYEKHYKVCVPIRRAAGAEPLAELGGDDEDQDHALARWLGRESFENTIAADRLELVDFAERIVPASDIDPRLAEALGADVEAFDWFEFTATGRLNQAMFDWHSAEFVYRCEQWLDAEAEFEKTAGQGLAGQVAGGA